MKIKDLIIKDSKCSFIFSNSSFKGILSDHLFLFIGAIFNVILWFFFELLDAFPDDILVLKYQFFFD